MSRSALTSGVTIEASRSLSPNRISSTATVSFSLMIGTSLASSSAASASRALLARVRSARSACVSSTCATARSRRANASSYMRIEHALPRRGRGLQEGHLFRAGGEAELLHAERDGAARDHGHAALLGVGAGHAGREHVVDPGSLDRARDPILMTTRRALVSARRACSLS